MSAQKQQPIQSRAATKPKVPPKPKCLLLFGAKQKSQLEKGKGGERDEEQRRVAEGKGEGEEQEGLQRPPATGGGDGDSPPPTGAQMPEEEQRGGSPQETIGGTIARASSIRRPKCRPPAPGPTKSAGVNDAGEPRELLDGEVDRLPAEERRAEGRDQKTLPAASRTVRKPSVCPPPPPPGATGRGPPPPPKLPPNPPPPPPQNCLAGSRSSSIYEEIETADNSSAEQSAVPVLLPQGKYTPKFRKKGNPLGAGGSKPTQRERRRTTQLDLLWAAKGPAEQQREGERLPSLRPGQMQMPMGVLSPPPLPCPCPSCLSAPSATAQSTLLSRSMLLDASCGSPCLVCPSPAKHSKGASGRLIADGLRQNLAKGMHKIRSHFPHLLLAATSSPSAQSKAALHSENFSSLTLGRVGPGLRGQSPQAGATAVRSSTFYLAPSEGEQEEEEEEMLFADDWSSSSSSGVEEGDWEERGGEGGKEKGPPPVQQSSSSSLLAAIESEYQRLMRQRQGQQSQRGRGHSPTATAPGTAVSSPSATAMDPPAADCPSRSACPPSPPLLPMPSVAPTSASIGLSLLPGQQPLYQILLLQEEEEEKIDGLGRHLLEPIGEEQTEKRGGQRAGPRGAEHTDPTAGDNCAELAEEVASSSSGCGTTSSSVSAAPSSASAAAVVRRHSSCTTTDSGTGGRANSICAHRPLARGRPTGTSRRRSQRSLWCELPEVRESGALAQMEDAQKKLQEAYFEVIASEASFLTSISFLVSHFMSAPELLGGSHPRSVISSAERKQLFSNVVAIQGCSERLLCQLESRLSHSLMLSDKCYLVPNYGDICDILCDHFECHFDAYVKYCSNGAYQDRALKRLKAQNAAFLACVRRLEGDQDCQGLDMRSFLMLPMQRITRYPLLLYAILDRLHPDQREHSMASRALTLAHQVVRNCNEGARRMERTEQLLDIESRLVYKCAELKKVPLVSSCRHLVKEGPLMQVAEKRPTNKKLMSPAGGARSLKARHLHLHLFSDLLLLSKRCANGTFVCKNYAFRRYIMLEPVELNNKSVPAGIHSTLGGRSPHLLFCVLLQDGRGNHTEYLLSAESETDRERWLSAMRPPTCANPGEKVYAEWDCPQAVAVHNYDAAQEDELGLTRGDLVNVLRKMPDGWFQGEKTRDGRHGWFPSSYVQEVQNDHVRAHWYKERFRVMQAASADYNRSSISSPPLPHQQRDAAPILSRIRRLSNPRTYFGGT